MTRTLLATCSALLLCLGLWGCSPQSTFDAYCRAELAPSSLRVNIEMDPLQVDHEMSRAQISEALRGDGTPVEGSLAMGSTTASLEQRSSLRFNSRSLLGRACAKPEATLTLRLSRPTVHIAREFPVNSCRYRTVELHEMMHVQAYEAALARTAAKARVLFDVRYPQSTLLSGISEDDLKRRAEQDLNEWLAPAVSRELAQVRERQRAIDSPLEYTRLTLACPEEPLPPPARQLAVPSAVLATEGQ